MPPKSNWIWHLHYWHQLQFNLHEKMFVHHSNLIKQDNRVLVALAVPKAIEQNWKNREKRLQMREREIKGVCDRTKRFQ